MFVSIRPINLNQILKFATGLLFILVLGVVIPNESFACHKDVPHGPHTCPPPDPDPDPPPDDSSILQDCDLEGFTLCIASVGKWHRPPAREFVEQIFGDYGNYTTMTSSQFSEILGTLTEEEEATALCDAYHVLIIEWSSPKTNELPATVSMTSPYLCILRTDKLLIS